MLSKIDSKSNGKTIQVFLALIATDSIDMHTVVVYDIDEQIVNRFSNIFKNQVSSKYV